MTDIDQARNTKKIELLGLPGVGKSTILRRDYTSFDGTKTNVPVGRISARKIRNVLHGALFGPWATKAELTNAFRSRDRKLFRRWLILCERIGRISRASSIVVDEGPLQAAWALYHTQPISGQNLCRFKTLVQSIALTDECVYIIATELDHRSFVKGRLRKHSSASHNVVERSLSSAWMEVMVDLLVESELLTFRICQNHRQSD